MTTQPTDPGPNPYAPLEYADPHPGMKGSERVWEECGWCTNGVYTGPGNVHWKIGKVDTTWCFQCGGNGGRYVLVSSVRARVRRLSKEAQRWVAEQADRERIIAETKAREWVEAWDAAHAEQERRAALVTGFVGDEGDKVKNLPGTVTVSTRFETASFNGYGTDYKAFVVVTLDDGKVVKTSGTGATLYRTERGQRVTVSGTVKGHDSYQGQDQTTLTRAKIDILDET